MPKIMVKMVCDVQASQPKAVPTSLEIPYKPNINAIENGYAPKPPLEKPTAKLPKIKPITTMSNDISAVSGSAKMAT